VSDGCDNPSTGPLLLGQRVRAGSWVTCSIAAACEQRIRAPRAAAASIEIDSSARHMVGLRSKVVDTARADDRQEHLQELQVRRTQAEREAVARLERVFARALQPADQPSNLLGCGGLGRSSMVLLLPASRPQSYARPSR